LQKRPESRSAGVFSLPGYKGDQLLRINNATTANSRHYGDARHGGGVCLISRCNSQGRFNAGAQDGEKYALPLLATKSRQTSRLNLSGKTCKALPEP